MSTLTSLYVLLAITIVIALILFVRILGIVRPNNWLICFARRFKGPWISYYLENGEIKSVPRRISAEERIFCLYAVPTMEIRRGPFKFQGTIRDFGGNHFQIAENGSDWVSLRDRKCLSIETALRLVNTYPSLQAMLDRIAELEKVRTEPLAVLIALDSKLVHNKQRFRSPAAKEIHANIRFALRELHAGGLTTNPKGSVAWMQNFEKPEAKVLR